MSIQNLGFAESAVWMQQHCAYWCPGRVSTFFQVFERILANGTICHIPSLKRWVHRQFHVDGKWNTEFYSKCLKNILCMSIWTWSDWIWWSDLLRESSKELVKCSSYSQNMELHQSLNILGASMTEILFVLSTFPLHHMWQCGSVLVECDLKISLFKMQFTVPREGQALVRQDNCWLDLVSLLGTDGQLSPQRLGHTPIWASLRLQHKCLG